jgi:hypothetical protein
MIDKKAKMSTNPSRNSMLLVAVLWFASCGGEPTNYDDCILDKIKEGMNREAVQAVRRACAGKFPRDAQPTPQQTPVTELDLLLLDGRAGLVFGNHFGGTIYNGLTDRTLKEVEVTVTTTIDGTRKSRTYRDEVSIPPQTAGDFGFDIITGDAEATYDWVITSAKGIKSN